MAINSRSKGCKNERMAAALFAKWTKKKFARTPSSGGLQWKTSNAKGDIVCTTEGHYFPFCIEVKAHKEIDFSHLLNPKIKNVKIFEFWEQGMRDATLAKKGSLLLMRYNNMPKDFFFIAIELNFFNYLFNQLPQTTSHILTYQTNKDGYSMAIVQSDEFFKLPYKKTKRLTKTYIKAHYEK